MSCEPVHTAEWVNEQEENRERRLECSPGNISLEIEIIREVEFFDGCLRNDLLIHVQKVHNDLIEAAIKMDAKDSQKQFL